MTGDSQRSGVQKGRTVYLSCDFSGIQRYVLGVKAAGGAQAKRLRARSFLLELYERAALVSVSRRLGVAEEDVLIQGGGGFLVELPPGTDVGAIESLASEMQRMMWDETGGEVHVSLGWGESPLDARTHLERRKRRPAFATLQSGGSWDPLRLSRPPLGEPCEVCGHAAGEREVEDDSEIVLHCRSCLTARTLGQRLTEWDRMAPSDGGTVEALGVGFEPVGRTTPGSFNVGRWIPRREVGREPLTFEEIAGLARGDRRLAVLKADVDDMGPRVAEVAGSDRTYRQLRSFSASLHEFFGVTVQEMLRESWSSIYTIYAGGDDLLMVGPWDVVLDFAGALRGEFEGGPAREFGPLTLSAGIALTPYRVPVRHAVDRGEELLESAKARPGKDRCAALGAVWRWDDHALVIGDGKRLARWVEDRLASRSLLHRLLRLAESDDPARAARWTYQVERNIRRNRSSAELHGWATGAMHQLDRDEQRVDEIAASLRYAMLATRGGQRGDAG